MYEHPYLTHLVSQVDLERQMVLIERARLAREHPERLVPRRGWIHRMLHRPRTVTPAAAVPEPAVAAAVPGAATPAAIVPEPAVSEPALCKASVA